MTKIPKKIHWCWLSGDPLPPLVQDCIKSWKRVMPDYEIILWDMNRFDIYSIPFVEQACAARKWAFASDYIRWYALYTEGGIYLDSDVKVYRRLDKFLQHSAFSGSLYYYGQDQNGKIPPRYWIEAECLGAEKGHPWMKSCLDAYQDKEFQPVKGVPSMGIASDVLTYTCIPFGWKPIPVSKPWHLDEGIVIYPETYFAYPLRPLSIFRTHAVHIGTGAWKDNNNSFVPKNDFLSVFRKWHSNMTNEYWWFRRYHLKRKELQKRIIELLKI